MLLSTLNTDCYSGYIKLNEDLLIDEFSGNIKEILRIENLELGTSFIQIGLNKNFRSFFENEVLPAIHSRKIRHLQLERKNSTLSLAVTPLCSGFTLLSFEETPQAIKSHVDSYSEKLSEVAIRVNSDLLILYVSKNSNAKFGRKASDLIGKTIEEIMLFDDNTPLIAEAIMSVFHQQKQKKNDFLLKKGEKFYWWNLCFIPDKAPSDSQKSVLIILKNINRYKLIEEKLFESEQRYQMATEASDLGIWDYIVDTGTTYFSRRWKSMLGYYPDEIDDKFSVWENLMHLEDKDRMTQYWSSFIESDLRLFEAEFRMRHKNGHYIWIRSRATALRADNGKAIRLLGTHRDITDEKKSINDFEKFHQAIIQSPISFIITDKSGNIEFFNPAFCKISGWIDHELVGKNINILKSGFQQAGFYEKLWKTISLGNEWQGEFKNKRKNGDHYWELASISPIRNSFGNITHYVKIAENITSLKKIENDLKKAKQEAEAANNYKNHFLSTMSHEIRTPINSIIGFSELMKNETLTFQKRIKYSEIIEENSQALLRLIDDIIDVAKIEANVLKIRKEACSLVDIMSELELTYKTFLRRKQKSKLEITFHVPGDDHHDTIFTDPFRLKQILNNLFINALKYSEIGKIEIGYSILNENKLRFFVSDTGSGISPTQIKTIFKRHNYSDQSTLNDTPSTGLGLSICKDLAILLGGDIHVKSVQGEGSVFYLSLPYDKIKVPIVRSAVKTAPQAQYNFSNFTIMIAEDTPYNYEYLYSILEKTGATILWAKDGIDVLKLFNNTKVDLILMDIQLPEISGYEAATQIRTTDQTIPIVAQTAYAMAEDRQKCLDAGCNEVLVKPMRMDEVLVTVARFLNK